MPKIDRHPAGTFCWIELATIDQAAAKHFYSALFGWEAVDSPAGPNEDYTTFKLPGGDAAAAYTMRPEERSAVTPHWNLYITVESADDGARRAGDLGGTVLLQPFDVMNLGRMAAIQDPTGAAFCIWQSQDHPGTTVAGEAGTLRWADLNTPDAPRAARFYEGLFGWKIGPVPNFPPEYPVIQAAGKLIAGITPPGAQSAPTPPHWLPFFLAGDIDGLAAQARQMGGALYLPPTSMGGARLAVLADPQGAVFAAIRPPA